MDMQPSNVVSEHRGSTYEAAVRGGTSRVVYVLAFIWGAILNLALAVKIGSNGQFVYPEVLALAVPSLIAGATSVFLAATVFRGATLPSREARWFAIWISEGTILAIFVIVALFVITNFLIAIGAVAAFVITALAFGFQMIRSGLTRRDGGSRWWWLAVAGSVHMLFVIGNGAFVLFGLWIGYAFANAA